MSVARSMMRLGLWFASLSLILQLISGDSSARLIAKFQPAKLAAFEGIYKTEAATPISVGGWVDSKNETVHSWKIPGALSLLTHRDLETPVTGLDQIPRGQWPNVPVVFQTYHIMIAMWLFMFLVALFGLIYLRKNRLERAPWLLWAMIVSVAFPHIAQQCGWISAEVGRQPWIVWNLMRVEEGVSTSISAGQVIGSIAMFVYPLLPGLLHLDPHAYGLWAGASIHEIAQVVAQWSGVPVTRLITSPARNPNVFTWYPCPVPGGHHGRSAASASIMTCHSSMLPRGSGARSAGRPAW